MWIENEVTEIVVHSSDMECLPMYFWKKNGKPVHGCRPDKEYLDFDQLFHYVVDNYLDPENPEKLYYLKLVEVIPEGFYTTDYDLVFAANRIVGFVRGYIDGKGIGSDATKIHTKNE